MAARVGASANPKPKADPQVEPRAARSYGTGLWVAPTRSRPLLGPIRFCGLRFWSRRRPNPVAVRLARTSVGVRARATDQR